MLNRRKLLARTAAAMAFSAMPGIPSARSQDLKRPPIRIGQIGVGHAHSSKLAVYRESADYEVVGIVEADAALRKRAESQAAYRGLQWMTQEQLLEADGLQAVLVETRVPELLDTAQACIAAGKHIHLDKPAGESLPQFRRILESAARQKLLVQMGYMYRYNPAVVRLRQFLEQGWLGDVFEVHAVMSKIVEPEERKRLAEFPGGMMFELGCHLLDLVIDMLGKPHSVSSFRQHAAPLDDNLADNMLAVLSYPRAIATVKSSAMEVAGGDRRHLVVCGTEGTFHIQPLDNPSVTVVLSKPRGEYKQGTNKLTFPRYVRYIDDAADMVRILRSEKQSDFPYDHDLAVQETVLQASGLPLDQ